MIQYRLADVNDLDLICRFTDYWLSGRGKRIGAPGAVDDCFVSPGQHRKYVSKYQTLIAFDKVTLVGWAVLAHNSIMIHLLVAGNHRCKGIGRQMVRILQPKRVRSKSDQSSGNPIAFYERLGFHKVRCEQSRSRLDIDKIKPNRSSNIDILEL